jgi:predicted permease
MNEVILRTLPIVIMFALGYVLKRMGVFKQESGELMLKIVFFVAAPALVLVSVSGVKLSAEFAVLPIIAPIVYIITFIVASLVGARLGLKRKSLGSFIVGSMLLNTSFALAFFLAAYGKEGLARATLFDFSNALVLFSFGFFVACMYGREKFEWKYALKRVVTAPPLIAMVLGLVLNWQKVAITGPALSTLDALGNMMPPLVMLALGIIFTPNLKRLGLVSLGIGLRMGLGLSLGFFFSWLFGLSGLSRLVVLVCCSTPVGFNTLTFASIENLDKELAANMVSYSILIALILAPLIVMFL